MRRFLLLVAFMAVLLPTASAQPAAVRVVADAGQPVGALDPGLWANVGYDPMYAATATEGAQPVWEAIRASGAFRYIRTHNLFTDGLARGRPVDFGTRIYSEDADGRPRYQWWFLDEVLDIWLSAGLKPILEMDFMPDALADGEIIRNYGGGAINGPRDVRRWRELIYETVRHVVARYGRDEVRTWYWEIWNEPDLYTYFIGGMRWGERFKPEGAELLARMYDHFVDGATAAEPGIRVGGPGLAVNVEFLRGFLRHVTGGTNHVTGRRGTRIDFISWHGYGSSEGMVARNRTIRAMIRNEFPSLAGVEVQQNEWGQALMVRGLPNTSSSFFTNYEAAFLARFVHLTLDDPSVRADRFLRWGQPLGTGRNPWRTLTRQIGSEVVRTPVFLAYDLMGRLGPERIAVTGARAGRVGAIAARSPGGVQVLLYHLDEGNEAGIGSPASVDLEVRGLDGTEVPAAVYRIDHGRGNFWPHWLAAGQSDRPTESQVRAILEAAALRTLPEPTRLTVEAGVARTLVDLPVNSVALVVLGREPRRSWTPGPHVRRVLEAEEAYKAAGRAAAASPDRGVVGYLAVAEQYGDLFWSQRALRAAIELLDRKGDPAAADEVRERLLRTPLGDPERLQRLQERAAYLRRAGRDAEAEALGTQISEIRARMARIWKWSD